MSTINKIATLATRQRFKTSRADAYQIVTGAIENGGVLSDDDMANLYAFFLPNIPKNKNDFQWVYSAVATDHRYYLNYVYVTDGEMVATDGIRLHVASTDLADGFYDKAETRVDVDATFPDYKRVIPAPKQPYTWIAEYCEVIDGGDKKQMYRLANGAGVNKRLWDAATQGAPIVDYDAENELSPIRVELDGNRFAVVMPSA